MHNARLATIRDRYDQRKYVVSMMGQDHLFAQADINYLLKEIKRLQAIEKAIQEYSGPNTYDGLIAWLESTTGYKGENV